MEYSIDEESDHSSNNKKSQREKEDRLITILVMKNVDKDIENEEIIKIALINIRTLARK